MLLKSPQFDVKLITTTNGAAEYRARIIAKMLMIARRTDIPIGLGEGGHDSYHGGQWAWVQDFRLADYPGKIYRDGVGAVIDVIERSPHPVTVISIGPLQTMAAVLEPESADCSEGGICGYARQRTQGIQRWPGLRRMQRRYGFGRWRKVLSAPWRQIAITPLDTCGLVNLSGERFQTLKRSHDPCVQALLENYRIWEGGERRESDGRPTSGQLDLVRYGGGILGQSRRQALAANGESLHSGDQRRLHAD